MDEIEKLTKIKSSLENEIKQLETKLETLFDLNSLIDEKLSNLSFTTAEVMIQKSKNDTKDIIPENKENNNQITHIIENHAYVETSDKNFFIHIKSTNKIPVDSGPMRFLLRSLDQYIEEDLEKIKKEIINADEKVSYKLEEDNGSLKTIKIYNFNSKERVNDLLEKTKWTIRTLLKPT